MRHRPLHLLALTVAFVLSLLVATPSRAETWTDRTGKFTMEAEYVGVQGANLVLRKADGTTIAVPIERLSAESRAQAKQLYQASAGNGGRAQSAPINNTPARISQLTPVDSPAGVMPADNTEPASGAVAFTPPTAPPVGPMPEFPAESTLQESLDFVKQQVMSGHPEILWHALPSDFRAAIDGSDFRNQVVPKLREQSAMNDQVVAIAMKVVQVLATKKEFVLNSQPMSTVPPNFRPLIQQGYDPVVGTLYELFSLSGATEQLQTMTMTDLLNERGPRLGGHLQSLIKLVPPQMIDQYVSQVRAEQIDANRGTITVPSQQGGTETINMVRYEGRWLPESFVTKWQADKDKFPGVLLETMQASQDQNAEALQQTEAMVGMVGGMVNGIIDPMLNASNQQQFDQALMQVVAMMQMFSGAGAPPGALGAPGELGPPGGLPPGGIPGGEVSPPAEVQGTPF
jgi:hypothetical protein